MPWRVALQDFGGHAPDAAATPRPMGTHAQVRETIDGALAEVAWPSAERATLRDASLTLTLDLGDAEPVERVDVTIDGDHPTAARPLVVHLCRIAGWAALDLAREAYLDLEADLDASLN